MLQYKQIDRMVAKVQRLWEVYSPFLITERVCPEVFIQKEGLLYSVSKGYKWGKDFKCATFQFTVENLQPNKKYYIYTETGGVEHQISVNGKKIGMIDYVAHAVDDIFRVHKYLLLENLQNGNTVEVDAYYSHTYPGTMPYDQNVTFALDGLYNRSYQTIHLVVFNQQLKTFVENLQMLNSHYQSITNGFARANVEKIYQRLFEILPIDQVCPTDEQLQQANAQIDLYFAEGILQKPFVGIVGHSHLDTAWLWTVEETKRKLMRTVSNAVTLLKRHPEYKFFMSTVLYLKWIEEYDSNLFQEVSDLIAQGRFEPNGSTWLECDGNLTGSEAMCRHFVRGKLYLREKFGYNSDTFWLPDTFGYSATLPQIMKQCGVNYFLTTKLSWNDTNKFPYETFIWKGIDGSEVPVHFNTIHCWADDKTVQSRLDNVLNPRESDHVLIAYGFGDGGGGPSEEMVANAIQTEKHFANADVKHVTVSEFMHRATNNKQLPTYFGELYLELHRGTYTMMHKIKQANRRLEQALHDAELVSVLHDDVTSKPFTDNLYDVLMLNQFHDILPGTCIAEANDVAVAELTTALNDAKQYICGNGNKKYFNTLQFARTELLPSKSGQSYVDLQDNKINLAPYKFEGFGYGKRANIKGQFAFDGTNITTPQLTAKLENGVLTSLIYQGREYVNGAFNTLTVAENVPYIYDNWDIDADYKLKEKSVEFVRQEVVSNGDYALIIRVTHKISEQSFIQTDIRFVADSPLVQFDNKLSVFDKRILVRSYFDTALHTSHYNCETQFGYVERNCYPRDVSDIAKFEVCSHKWTDLSEKNCGISLLSDTKYGVSCQGSMLGITLHKGGTHPDARGDVGVSYFSYALLPHTTALDMQTVQNGYTFNLKPVATARQNLSCPFHIDNYASVVLETVKQGEKDGVVLRLYESLGDTCTITINAPNKKIVLCNILEDEQQILSDDGVAKITFSPFQIVTVKLV